jgi:fructose-1-phosphate kinase PfkB-like protein
MEPAWRLPSLRSSKQRGVGIVVTSMGSEGGVLVTSKETIRAYPPEIEVVNTIGSGDSMVAGFACALQRKESLYDMFKLGMACAAANARLREIGVVTLELVQKYLQEIKLESI